LYHDEASQPGEALRPELLAALRAHLLRQNGSPGAIRMGYDMRIPMGHGDFPIRCGKSMKIHHNPSQSITIHEMWKIHYLTWGFTLQVIKPK